MSLILVRRISMTSYDTLLTIAKLQMHENVLGSISIEMDSLMYLKDATRLRFSYQCTSFRFLNTNTSPSPDDVTFVRS